MRTELHIGCIKVRFQKDGLFAIKCDNPACINPNHLFAGTAKQNTDDMSNKGRGLYGRKPIILTDTKTGRDKIFKCQREVADYLGINQGTVSYAIKKGSLLLARFKAKFNQQTVTPKE